MERAAKIIAIILDNTCNNFFEINFSDFIIMRKSKHVINRTRNKDIMWVIVNKKLLWVSLEDTITEVIAAGPANNGIAKGKTEVVIILLWIDFSFLADLLSNSISIEINNNIIPPAILKEYKFTLKWFKIDFPITRKKTNIKNAKKVASAAILYLFSFILCSKVRNIVAVPKGSITTK